MTITQFETRYTQGQAIGQQERAQQEYEVLRNFDGSIYQRLAHLDPGLAYGLERERPAPRLADEYKRKGG